MGNEKESVFTDYMRSQTMGWLKNQSITTLTKYQQRELDNLMNDFRMMMCRFVKDKDEEKELIEKYGIGFVEAREIQTMFSSYNVTISFGDKLCVHYETKEDMYNIGTTVLRFLREKHNIKVRIDQEVIGKCVLN